MTPLLEAQRLSSGAGSLSLPLGRRPGGCGGGTQEGGGLARLTAPPQSHSWAQHAAGKALGSLIERKGREY